jgi:hypothetical protein
MRGLRQKGFKVERVRLLEIQGWRSQGGILRRWYKPL